MVAALEDLAWRPQTRRQVEVRPAADGIADHELAAGALSRLDQVVDRREVVDRHRLLELRVLEAAAAFQDEDVLRIGTRCAVELGQAPCADRTAEAGADDADIDALGHYAR